MRTSKLDVAAASWATWLAKKKTSSLGFVISLVAAIAWLVVYLLTQKYAHAGVAMIWLFAAFIQFERRGFTLLLDLNTSDVEKRSPNKSVQTTAMTPPPSTTRGAPLSDL